MKRLWIGIVVLSVLLLSGVLVSCLFAVAHGPTTALLEEATDAALGEDWPRAVQLLRRADARWQAYWRFTAAFADHSPMDEIDGLFAQLETLGKQKSRENFPALCARLAELTEAMADSHRFRWWTLL